MRPLAELAAPLLLGAGYLPERASSVAASIDGVFHLVFWISAFFLALIVAATLLFVVRYRARPGRPGPEPSPDQHLRLELLWTGVPLALVLLIFAASTKVYLEMTSAQADEAALRVQVTGRRWAWWFDHPGGRGANELHLVAGRPAELVLASTDVIHSLYVPEFRLKQDAVPGRFGKLRFTPTVAGTYAIVCAEYCGTNHSKMGALAVVHPDQASFDAWARQGAPGEESLVDLGKRVFAEKACNSCHSDDGTPGVGPSAKGLWGKLEKLQDGSTVRVDEAYVRESILAPGARLVAGFEDVMPPMPLDEREILGVIAYLQSLKEGP